MKVEMTIEDIVRLAYTGLQLGNVGPVLKILEDTVRELDRREAEKMSTKESVK